MSRPSGQILQNSAAPASEPESHATVPAGPVLAGSPSVSPLSAAEWLALDRVLRRLHEHIRSFLSHLPADARTASGMSRFLEVDRTTCQRLVFTAARPFTGYSLLDRLPGVRGLRQLIQAARAGTTSMKQEPVAAFEAAVDQFEETLRNLGGSQSSLIRRLAAAPAPIETKIAGSDDPLSARRRLFDAAAELTGRYSETWVAVYAYYPWPRADVGREAATIAVARAHGLIGHVARANAVPLTFHNFTSKRPEDDDPAAVSQAFHNLNDDVADDRAPASVLREFSTNPPPVVSSRQPGEYLVQAIDTHAGGSGTPVDLMFGTRSAMPHPMHIPPGIEEVWAMINFPARRLLFDVYMHRDLARTCIPALDTHLWRPDFAANIGDRWQTRFADGPRLELLGSGITRAATPSYSRHAELTSFLFQRLHLESDKFIGYRCAVEFPMWRTGYCMSFDFNAGDVGPVTPAAGA